MKRVDANEMQRRVIERFESPEQGRRLLVKAGVLRPEGGLSPRHKPEPGVEASAKESPAEPKR